MPKRFTDSEKWSRKWFRELPPKMKLLWLYILDTCEHSGIWEKDFEQASFLIKETITEDDMIEHLSKQYIDISKTKIFIIDYIPFQYKCEIDELDPNNNAHKKAIEAIKKYNLINRLKTAIDQGLVRGRSGAGQGLVRGLGKGKGKVKGKRKDKNTINNNNNIDELDKQLKRIVDNRKKEVRNKYGFYKHVFLTVKQYDNLIEDFGKIQLDEMIKILDEYLQMKGAKYKDHNLVLRGWVLKEWNKRHPNKSAMEYKKQINKSKRWIQGDKIGLCRCGNPVYLFYNVSNPDETKKACPICSNMKQNKSGDNIPEKVSNLVDKIGH